MERSQKSRITVKLLEQNRQFALDKKKPIDGDLRIDGEVSVEASNLDGKAGKYKLFFIGRKSGSSVYTTVGTMTPDEFGRVDFHIKIDPENIDGEGTALSDFYIFMIAAEGMPLQPVLKGDLQRDRIAPQGQRRGRCKEYNSYYVRHIRDKVAQLRTESLEFSVVSPFNDAWLAEDWLRVNDLTKLPVASMGADKLIRRYRHFIFSVKDDMIYLGVPGRNLEEDWPEHGASGFRVWKPIKGSAEYGYWCMAIDWKSGIITEIP